MYQFIAICIICIFIFLWINFNIWIAGISIGLILFLLQIFFKTTELDLPKYTVSFGVTDGARYDLSKLSTWETVVVKGHSKRNAVNRAKSIIRKKYKCYVAFHHITVNGKNWNGEK